MQQWPQSDIFETVHQVYGITHGSMLLEVYATLHVDGNIQVGVVISPQTRLVTPLTSPCAVLAYLKAV